MYDAIREIAAGMTVEEKKALVAELRAAIAEDLAPGPGDPLACPRCGCERRVRKGRAADGSQRRPREGCGRTFGATTRGPLAASKLPPGKWMAYAERMADRLGLRESAAGCGAGPPTSRFMRIRLCEAMASRPRPFRQRASRQAGGMAAGEGLSGNHSRSEGFSMPRRRRRSGSDSHKRGIPDEKVCVMTGADGCGGEFAVLCCRGRERAEDVLAACEGRVGEGTDVATDMHRSYPRAMEALGASSHVKAGPGERSDGDINLADSMHSRPGGFLSRFHGVATRRLQNYLDWFCYAEQSGNSDADRREVLFGHAAEGSCGRSRREMLGLPHPFMEYWDACSIMSNVV